MSVALAQFQRSVCCLLSAILTPMAGALSVFSFQLIFLLSCLSCPSYATMHCFDTLSGLVKPRVRDSGTLDPVGERNLIMAIAIEDVVTLLDQLREGLVEMRGYL